MFKLNKTLVFIVVFLFLVVVGEGFVLYKYNNPQDSAAVRLAKALQSDGDFEQYKKLVKNKTIRSSIITTEYVGTLQNIHFSTSAEKDGTPFKVFNFDLFGEDGLKVPFILGPGIYRRIKVSSIDKNSKTPFSIIDLKNKEKVQIVYTVDLKLVDSSPIESVKEVRIIKL